MTYANIKLKMNDVRDENHNLTGEKKESVIYDVLVPLMEALALKYPHWEFVEVDSRAAWEPGGIKYQAADGFKVYEKREELGHIRVDHWYRGGKRFWIDNFRIDAQRSRGSGYKTKHLDKAMKHIAKYFGAKDHSELMDSAEKTACYVKNSIVSDLGQEKRGTWRKLDDYAEQFLLTQWGAFEDWMKQLQCNPPTLAVEKYPEACANYDEAKFINDLIEKGEAWLVKLVNSDYIVKQGEQVSVMASESLPATVRRNLGMLKLVQDRQLISTVGIRVDETTYYVLGDTE